LEVTDGFQTGWERNGAAVHKEFIDALTPLSGLRQEQHTGAPGRKHHPQIFLTLLNEKRNESGEHP